MPTIGDKIWGPELGRITRRSLLWLACPDCGKERWVGYDKRENPPLCVECSHSKKTRTLLTQTGAVYWDGIGVAEEGMITTSANVGKRGKGYFVYYTRCPICGKLRWIQKQNIGGKCRYCRAVQPGQKPPYSYPLHTPSGVSINANKSSVNHNRVAP